MLGSEEARAAIVARLEVEDDATVIQELRCALSLPSAV
jgi:hypothetical protein